MAKAGGAASESRARPWRRGLLVVALVVAASPLAFAQLGKWVAPGPLAKAHVKSPGLQECGKCHAPGGRTMAELCLSCHKPIAERIARKAGVHRDVKNDCRPCHVEHRGEDGALRVLNTATFDHAAETGFAISGRHAEFTRDCARCHKTRSFLDTPTTCAGCHKDIHKPTLGSECTKCHAVATAFKQTRNLFDHTKAAYQLAGAHLKVDCAKCHADKVYKGLKFAQCVDCHKSPHRQRFAPETCLTCHSNSSWRTTKADHARTPYPLKGKHAELTCVKCHVKSPVKETLKFDRCTACHQDPHRGTFRQDCASCHNESGFKKGKFDHDTGTKFPLTGKHAESLACAKCHKNVTPGTSTVVSKSVDFRGLATTCVSCHADVHKSELGVKCDTCHTPATFKLPAFKHPRFLEFFAGQHQAVSCAACHVLQKPGEPRRVAASIDGWTFKTLQTACVTCHKDVHLGQVGPSCEKCHTIDAAKFAPTLFAHAKATYQLTGKHQAVECAKCHKSETAAFPTGTGTAVRLKGLSTACSSCHKDQHLGQLGAKCDQCHTSSGFKIAAYTHVPRKDFFVGKHATKECVKCHKAEDAVYPSGRGKIVRYKGTGTLCATCHEDTNHHGSLGKACETCHDPNGWKNGSRAFHKLGAFPLEGRHLTVECAACHWNGTLKGTPTRCDQCHWTRRQDDRFQTRLGIECGKCHRPTSWAAVNWNHGSMTGVQLTPAHRALGCEGCHKDQSFTASNVLCYSCHSEDYRRALSPSHQAAGFPTTCEVCHLTSQTVWSQARFNHQATYVLVGTHATQPCAACHKNAVYKGTTTDCYGCHRTDYDRSLNPSHVSAGFPTACITCHQNSDPDWHARPFNHNVVFPLPGVHATQSCAACHKNGVYKGTGTDCYSCHRTDYERTQNPGHASAGFSTSCEVCHKMSESSWHTTFNHNNFYPLVGLHANQDCAACHKSGVYRGTSTTCYSCHKGDYERSQNPNHLGAGMPTSCETCHRPSDLNWRSTFNHASVFQLVGVHSTQPCASCHKNGVFGGTPRDCYGCHKTDYERTLAPNHLSAGFSTSCDSCHRAADPNWHTTFNHNAIFQLVGLHATQPCAKCHVNNIYKGTPRNCFGCHQSDYTGTTNPNHAAAGFSTTCESCHSAASATWSASFNHNAVFQLVGVHATQPCAKCHVNNVYHGTPRNCFGCHQTDYTGTTNPNHVAAGFPTTCESCHSAASATWSASFNHSTYFQLVGVHATQPCSACHVNGVYHGTPRNCYGCHQTDYTHTTNPNHVAAGFPTTCESCHSAASATWSASFNHNTIFQLVGVHATQPCTACHINNVYHGTPRDCYGCHRTTYEHTTNPNHVAAGFPTTCESCHSAASATWSASFNHSTFFQLVGVHATQPCSACHINGVYHGTPRICFGCHQTDYTATTNPNHAAAGFPTTCESCHSPAASSWTATFNHNTIFQLVGVHATQPCTACHINNVYHGTPRDCYGCHRTTYEHTTNPNHVAAGFPTTCDTCHSPASATWASSFNHSTVYPLLGRHLTAACTRCHVNNVYHGTPRICYACHVAQYNATTNPNHIAAGFPTACEPCHKASDSSFTLGVFNHTWFPIASGRHSGNPCAACHTNPAAYSVFSCLTGCHPKSSTDSHHQGRSGYRYESAACYSCHPQGRAD